jgi:peptide/nickel transport system ATP-binding protein
MSIRSTTDHSPTRVTERTDGPATAPAPSAEGDASASLLEVEHLHVGYRTNSPRVRRRETHDVVHDVSFAVGAGRTVALIGESGSGKSTIARAVLRLLPRGGADVRGAVRLRGRELTDLSERSFRALRGSVLGFVPQDPGSSLNPVRTIGAQGLEAAALVPEARTGTARTELVLEALDRVRLPDPRRVFDSYPHQLSGGQLQRVLIALAVLPRPALLVADEPTSALDVTVQKQILDLLAEVQADLDLGTLLITHDLAVAAQRSDELIVLRGGVVQEAGPTRELFACPTSEYTRTLQADVPGLNPDRLADIRAARPDTDPSAPSRVRLEGVSRTFGAGHRAVHALTDVGIALSRGRTHALVGESGSGKSTAARIVMGLERADTGELRIDGDLVRPERREALRGLRRHLQMVHQNPFTSLDPRWSVRRIVRESLDHYRVGTREERAQDVAWALGAVRLGEQLWDRRPGALSGGQRQRVAIARALVLRPEVLVLDEPTSALDVTVQAEILQVLAELQRDLGLTYLFISHDLGVVRQVADTLTVLQDGEVVEEGAVRDVFARPTHDYTRRLLAAIPDGRRDTPSDTPEHDDVPHPSPATDHGTGSRPADARRVLPGSGRTELVTTGLEDPRVAVLHAAMDAEVTPRYAARREHRPAPGGLRSEQVVTVVLALVDGVPAATGALRRWGTSWEVKRLFVAPEQRRRGLARAVLDQLGKEASRRGGDHLQLQTGNLQPEAMSLYEHEGWERVPVFAPYDPDDGISVCFSRPLSPVDGVPSDTGPGREQDSR